VAKCVIAIVGVVVVQLVVAFAYRMQFQLQLQLIILRFVLLPIALLQLVAQT
jgi:type IV secretory pathway VirB2 component (pilin)